MKTFISNRDGLKLCVVVEESKTPGKLAFVMHGLGGNKEQGLIRAIAEALLSTGYTVITFDAAHTFGESEGDYEDATITNYCTDLEDVIAWASHQSWYAEPFVLCGHSLGGIAVALFAESYPKKVNALAPLSTVVSGRLSLETKTTDQLEAWKKTGIQITKRHDGVGEKRLKWSHVEDRLKYDLLPNAAALTMPVLLVVGEKDTATPVAHQQILHDALPGNKEIHVIKGALHSFYEPHEQQELKQFVKQWIEKL